MTGKNLVVAIFKDRIMPTIIPLCLIILLIPVYIYSEEEPYFIKMRQDMVKTQLEGRGIKDRRVLDAMLKVQRHKFVPAEYKMLAYSDSPLPIGKGQTISQPYIVALMTELLQLKGAESVLEIGTGSGYQAAILAELARRVYTIEILPELANHAGALLRGLGYENIIVKCGDGYLGWQEYAPFDAIIITCAPRDVPDRLIEQLANGGRMVVPVGELYQELLLIEKDGSKIKRRSILPVRFVPMIHSH